MIDDDELRNRLNTVLPAANPTPATRGNSTEQARRGTSEFDELIEDLEQEYDLDDETLDGIVEIRWPEDGDAEYRLKGEQEWKKADEDDGSEEEEEEEEDDLCYEDCSCPQSGCDCELCPCGKGKVCCCACGQ